MKEIFKHSDETKIGLTILNSEAREGLHGVLTGNGLVGILEGEDIKKQDIIVESQNCPVTTV